MTLCRLKCAAGSPTRRTASLALEHGADALGIERVAALIDVALSR